MKILLCASMVILYSARAYSLELYAMPKKQYYRHSETVEIVITIKNNSSYASGCSVDVCMLSTL